MSEKLKILIAPDKFKGSLSAMDVCRAIGKGLEQQGPKFDIQFHPMADGGDGSLAIIDQHLNLEKEEVKTSDPLGRPIATFYYRSGRTAFVELAKASGIVLLDKSEYNPLKTSTIGTGKMIVDAIAKGCNEIYIFLGGSSTNDGGMGIAHELGIGFFDANHETLYPCGENLSKVVSIHGDPFFDSKKIKFTLLCDVTNPLYGPNGAAQVYARQKGADDAMMHTLDLGLKHFSERLLDYSGIDMSQRAGSGAAGGIAAALGSIFKATMKSGTETLAELTNLESQIQNADIVISGEGKLDSQSLQGKVIDGIAKLCKKHNKPLVLFVGKNELSKLAEQDLSIEQIFAVFDEARSLQDAMQNAPTYLRQLAYKYSLI